MNEPSAQKEGWSTESNRGVREGFVVGRLCNSWQHFCSCPCPEAWEPTAGVFSSDSGKNKLQSKSTKAHWPHSIGTKDCIHLAAQKELEMCMPSPIKLVNRDSVKIQDLYYFRERLQSKCEKPNKLNYSPMQCQSEHSILMTFRHVHIHLYLLKLVNRVIK